MIQVMIVLAKLAPEVLFGHSREEASLALEHLLQSHDPCISRSTYCLKLKHERVKFFRMHKKALRPSS